MKIYHIYFKRKSRFAYRITKRGVKSFYQKKEVFDLLRNLKEKDCIEEIYERKTNEIVSFSLDVLENSKMSTIVVEMNPRDPYHRKFEKLLDFKRKQSDFSFKRMISTFGLISACVLLNPLPLEDDYPEKLEEEVDVPETELEYCEEETTTLNVEETFLDSFFETYLEKYENLSVLDENVIMTFQNERWIQNEGAYHLEEVAPFIRAIGIENSIDFTFEVTNESLEEEYIHDLTCYDENVNNINKLALIDKFIMNSLLTDELMNGGYLSLEEDELWIIMDQIYDYIEEMKQQNPNFDVEHFICNLEECSVYKNTRSYNSGEETYAFCKNWYIIWNSFQEEYGDMNEWVKINKHEFSHMNHFWCPDEDSEYLKILGGSIYLKVSPEILIQTMALQPYCYDFMDEWAAEKTISTIMDENVSTYVGENEVMSNLEFALSIHPYYQKGTLLSSYTERNPMKLYQSFPCLYDEKEELVDYVQMLKCYDYSFLNGYQDYLLMINKSFGEDVYLKHQEQLYEYLLHYAEMKHVELFYKNLWIANETLEQEMAPEEIVQYDRYMISLFEKLMRKQETQVYQNMNLDLENILLQGANFFLSYLQEKYPNIEIDTSFLTIEELRHFSGYPSYVDEEKLSFYHELMDGLSVNIYQNASVLIKK